MAKVAVDISLEAEFTAHLKETEEHVARLEGVAEHLGIRPGGKMCFGMEGCIKEGADALEEEGNERVLDLGLIGAANRLEHYEMSGCINAISLAKCLGSTDVVWLLKASVAEEQAGDEKLRTIVRGV